MDGSIKEVYFDEYCYRCKFRDLNEADDPCRECLTWGSNEMSHRPIMFEEESK